jgi:hypothetical protein
MFNRWVLIWTHQFGYMIFGIKSFTSYDINGVNNWSFFFVLLYWMKWIKISTLTGFDW